MVTIEEIMEADVNELGINKQVEALYKGTSALAIFSQNVMRPLLSSILNLEKDNLSDKDKAVIGTYYRMHGWILCMAAMKEAKHFQGAGAAARSLFELLVDLKELAEDKTGEKVAKYHAFTDVEKYRVAKKMVEFVDQHPNDTSLDVSIQRVFINDQGRPSNSCCRGRRSI